MSLKPALFLHIQKTAGTTFLQLIKRFYGHNMTSYGDCWGSPPEKFREVAFVSGHVGYDYCKPLLQSRYSFTFLRNPIDRVLSMYYFCRGRNSDEFMIYRKANELDLEQFIVAAYDDPWVKKNIWNNQVWQLAHGYAHLDGRSIDSFPKDELLGMSLEHLSALSYVGLTENFEEDCKVIFSALGLPPSGEKVIENANATRPRQGDISEGTIDIIRNITELDQKLYDHVMGLRQRRVE